MPWRGLKSGSASKDALPRSPRMTVVDSHPPRLSVQLLQDDTSMDQLSAPPGNDAKNSSGTGESRQESPAPDNSNDEQDLKLRPTKSQQAPKSHRFSLLRFRHASDPELSASYTADEIPPVPAIPPPTIITTSPTMGQVNQNTKQRRRPKIAERSTHLSSDNIALDRHKHRLSIAPSFNNRSTPDIHGGVPDDESLRKPHVSFEDPPRHSATSLRNQLPPPYGDESNSSLALPVTRLSDSSRSDASSGDNGIYATTTTTHTVHTTTTTFFRLPRRKKGKGPLFPLPVKISPPTSTPSGQRTPNTLASARNSESPDRPSPVNGEATVQPHAEDETEHPSPLPSPSHSHLALTNAPSGTPIPTIVRKDSNTSHRSATSLTTMPPPPLLGNRGRSSTMGSGRERDPNHTPSGSLIPSGRTSTSTAGRKSIGDLFTFSHRLRQQSEPLDPRSGSSSGMPGTPGSVSSKPNSFSLPREAPSYPERDEDDTPAGYLEKLEHAVNRGVIATILCKSADEFSQTCLRKYMRGFSYFGDSIDMAVRKMLMEVELPKETQQIDRLLQGFANRYCECNPGVFVSADEAYFVAFSILLLHSDAHNKNNKKKMQKHDYIRNTQDQVEVSQDILECFFDNVSYTPFIHFEDEVAINSHRLAGSRSKINLLKRPSNDSIKGPVDPYALILDNKLDQLRPPLKGVMHTEDTYSATGTGDSFDSESLHLAFLKSGVLQIVSARSRPDAFLTPATTTNPSDAQAGLVDIKAAKVGLLWRKDPKKKKARSPWQEWGAILTSSQLYFFKDVAWVKTLMTQAQIHLKNGNDAHAVTFRPPLTEFKPDALMSMDDSVALVDSSYKKHKNAFTFIKHGGFEEVFLANDEADMNDWIAKLNYAATFRTSGIRMRGIAVTTNYEGRRRSVSRTASAVSERTIATAGGDVFHQSRKPDPNLVQEIATYRRQLMLEKINEANEKLGSAQKELDNLLRNARHLEIQSPIQAKTREGLVFAAGKMSAKLKWIRVEMWRTKCHRDILRLDMEEEERKNPQLVGREPSVHPLASQQVASPPSQAALARLESAHSSLTLSPKSTKNEGVRPFSSASTSVLPTSETPEPRKGSIVSKHSSQASLKQSAAATLATADLKEDFVTPQSSPVVHGLSHKPSTISTPSRSEVGSLTNATSRLATPTRNNAEVAEERILRDKGLIGADGSATSMNRPGTSGSDPEPLAATQAEGTPLDRSKVRRSLHRTLRDSHGPHLPSHNRSKKGRDSNSGSTIADDSVKSPSEPNEGLARGTGSFIVHGKKASVITFGQDWALMSPEQRLKSKRETRESMKSLGDITKELTDNHGPTGLEVEREASLTSTDLQSISMLAGGSEDHQGPGNASDVEPSEKRRPSAHSGESVTEEFQESSEHPGAEKKGSSLLQEIYA